MRNLERIFGKKFNYVFVANKRTSGMTRLESIYERTL